MKLKQFSPHVIRFIMTQGRILQKELTQFTYQSPFGFRFCCMFFPLGFFSLPMQYTPPGPVTLTHSRPLEDFLNVNSTSSPSIRLRNPSMCSLLWDSKKRTIKACTVTERWTEYVIPIWNIKIFGWWKTIQILYKSKNNTKPHNPTREYIVRLLRRHPGVYHGI